MNRYTVYNLLELSQLLNGVLKHADELAPAQSMSIDSRTLKKGSWFVCIRGERTDGHRYLAQALEKGAAGAVLDPDRIPGELRDRAFPQIRVSDPNQALRDWAAEARRRFQGRVLGITGSNGKTSTKELLARLCKGMGSLTHATRGNFNNFFGVPLTLLEAQLDAEWWIVEMGTNQFGEIAELSRIVRPDGAILTCISESHLEFLDSTEGVAHEKGGLVLGMSSSSPLVVPAKLKHLELIREYAEEAGVRLVRVQIEDGGADAGAEHRLQLLENTKEVLRFQLFEHEFRMRATNPLQLSNLAVGLVLLRECGVEAELLRQGLSKLDTTICGRFKWIRFENGWLVDDTYNANPGSFRGVLDAIRRMHPQQELLVVAGSMAELGVHSSTLHREVGEVIRQAYCKRLFVFGGSIGEDYLEGWRKAGGDTATAKRFEQFSEMLKDFWKYWSGNGIVLVKGSRSARMERFVEALLEEQD